MRIVKDYIEPADTIVPDYSVSAFLFGTYLGLRKSSGQIIEHIISQPQMIAFSIITMDIAAQACAEITIPESIGERILLLRLEQ